jgi:DNA-directed RNA polymerase specialized sigma24 family protein
MKKKNDNYLDNKRFEELIFLYLDDPRLHEDELMALFDTLISTIIDSFNFKVDRDDAKQECFVLVLRTLKNFTRDRGSAFNYFTTVIINNLRLVYTKNRKYLEKINKYIETNKDLFQDQSLYT